MRCLLALGCLIAVSGCSESMTKASEESMDMQAGETQESVQASMGEFRVAMLHKAETLAEEEMARLAAIELLYKNISEMQMEIIPAELRRVGGWVKSYRKYTGYEINDIYRSDSYLNPIVFEIAYQFDQFHTEVRTWENMKSQGLSMKDKKFKMIKKDALIRRYRCDENGDYLGNLPEMPPRPSIFIETYFNQDRVAEEFEGIANPLPAK